MINLGYLAFLLGILHLCTIFMAVACPNGCKCGLKSGKEMTECSGPAIVSFPEGIPTTTQVLFLGETNVTYIPDDAFSNLPKLTGIQIIKNRNLQTLPAGIFNQSSLKNLELVNLNYNSLATLPENLFNNLPNLYDIRLNDNNLVNLPSNTFRNLPSLNSIEAAKNKLTSLSENLFDNSMKNVHYLYLTDNKLSSLPDGIFKPVSNSLKSLLIDENRFKILPMNAFRILGKNFKEIKVVTNPTFCNCSLAEFAVWAKYIIHTRGVTCDGRETKLNKINITHCELPTTMPPTTKPLLAKTPTTTKVPTTTKTPSTTKITSTIKIPSTTKIPSTKKTPSTTNISSTTPSTAKVPSTSKIPPPRNPSTRTMLTREKNMKTSSSTSTQRVAIKSKVFSTPTTESLKIPDKGDVESQDTSDENEKRKTVIIAVSVAAVTTVVLLAIIMCLLHTGIISLRCGMRFRKEKVVIYDAEGNVLMTEKDGGT